MTATDVDASATASRQRWRRADATTVVLHWLVTARVRLDAERLRDLRSPDRRRRWRSANVLIYWLAYALLAAAVCTGLLMFSDVVNRARWAVADIHRLVAWALVGYVVLHVTAQLATAG